MIDIDNHVSNLLNIADALGYTMWIEAEASNGYEGRPQIVWNVRIHRGAAYHNSINPIAEGYHIDLTQAFALACKIITEPVEPMINVA